MVRLGIEEQSAPIVAKAMILKRHLLGVLNYLKHRLTNVMSEVQH